MAGLKDIAIQAGVSIKTASRAIRGEGYVAAEKKQRILEIASSLGYVPNRAAQSLRSNRSSEITMVIWSLRSFKFSDNMYLEQMSGVESILEPNRLTMKVRVSQSIAEDESYAQEVIEGVIRNRPLGVILYPLPIDTLEKLLKKLEDNEIPTIVISSVYDVPDYDFVTIRLQSGVNAALELMYRNGRRKIAYIGTTVGSRLNPYNEFVQKNKLEPIHFNMAGGLSPIEHYELGIEFAERFLAENMPYEGLLAYNDYLAFGFIQKLRQEGIRIPEQISVVGIDNNNVCMLCKPNLTSISYPHFKIGELAAEMLMERISGKRKVPGRHENAKAELIVRGSV